MDEDDELFDHIVGDVVNAKLLVHANHIVEYPEDVIATTSGQRAMDKLVDWWMASGQDAMS